MMIMPCMVSISRRWSGSHPNARSKSRSQIRPERSIRAVATTNPADPAASMRRNAGSSGSGAGGTQSRGSTTSGTRAAINRSRTPPNDTDTPAAWLTPPSSRWFRRLRRNVTQSRTTGHPIEAAGALTVLIAAEHHDTTTVNTTAPIFRLPASSVS
jgi:hypothetical protein